MKYKYTSTVHKYWSEGSLRKFREEIESTVMNMIIPSEEYILGKFNLLKNEGHIQYYHIPHRDYPPHLTT